MICLRNYSVYKKPIKMVNKMIKIKKASLYVLLGLLMLASGVLGCLFYPKVNTVALAESETEIKLTAAVTGTDGDVFTPVEAFGYSPTNGCLYITNNGGVVEGKIKIPEITATEYKNIVVYVGNMWGTAGAEDIYWNFYNANGYNAENSAPAYTYVQGKTMAGTGNKTLCYATIPVSDIADANGAVSEIVVEAYDGAKNTAGMQMYIYGVTLEKNVAYPTLSSDEDVNLSVAESVSNAAISTKNGFAYSSGTSANTQPYLFISVDETGYATGEIQFPEISVNDFEYVRFYFGTQWSTAGEQDIIWSFYNVNGYTSENEPNFVYNQGKQTAGFDDREKCFADVPVQRLADENGNAKSVIVKCYDGAKGLSMQMYVFGGRAIKETVIDVDYELPIDGEAMIPGAYSGDDAQSATGVSHLETEKIYYNGFKAGQVAQIVFPAPISARTHKTLKLSLSAFGASNVYNYTIAIFPSGCENVTTALPKGLYTVQTATKTTADCASELVLKTSDYADDLGKIKSLTVLYVGDDSGKNDGCNLFLFGASVLRAESDNYSDYSGLVKVSKATLRNTGENYALKLAFSATLSKVAYEMEFDGLKDFFASLKVNGKTLEKESVEKVEISANELTVCLKKALIKNLGEDTVSLSFGGKIVIAENTESAIAINYTFANDLDLIVTKTLGAGEETVLEAFARVKSVSCEYGEENSILSISFSSEIFGVPQAAKDKILLNGKTLTALNAQIAFEKNVLFVTVNSAALEGADGNAELTIEKGFNADGAYINERVSYYRFSDREEIWFLKTEDELTVLWVDGFELGDEYAIVNLKTTADIDGDIDFSKSDALRYVLINEKPLADMMSNVNNSVIISGNTVTITLSIADSGLKGLETDEIVIKKGFALPNGGTAQQDKVYRYSTVWENFEVVSNLEEVKALNKIVTVDKVETATNSTVDSLYLHVIFNLPLSYRYMKGVHKDLALCANGIASVPSSNPTDLMLSELAYYGVITSIGEKILYDGKTLNQWLIDFKGANDWSNIVNVEFLGISASGANYEFCKRMQITLHLGEEYLDYTLPHTIEFKEGLVSPTLQMLEKTFKYKWDVELQAWVGDVEQIEIEKNEGATSNENVATQGCAAAVENVGVWAVCAVIALGNFARILYGKRRFVTKKRRDER